MTQMQTLPTNGPGTPRVAVIGAGPAGLMAAEVLAGHGLTVDVYDAMPSAGRKFLLAGRGGMNITHSEPQPDFLPRYGNRREQLAPFVRRFDADRLRQWIHELGIETFVGSSGRVFPREMKAAPLLRAWLHRLREAGVHLHMRHRWLGWHDDGSLRLAGPEGETSVRADAVVLALGGASWPRLGSDGSWVPLLQARQVEVAPLLPSNCGFELDWSTHFRERFAGEPVKPVVASVALPNGGMQNRRGEFIITAQGIEGGLVYALSAALREGIAAEGSARLYLDLLPDWPLEKVETELAHPRGARSLSSHLQSRLHLKGVKAGLLRELMRKEDFADMGKLARAIKALPLPVLRPRPIAEAISSAGGVGFEALDDALMLRALPGVFCAGEMLDWEAPTGGYLLTACFATGHAAGHGAARWLKGESREAGLATPYKEGYK